ncbi:sodium- and chloride-dependent glycine transporter 1 isoform X2 [Drosophila grimshawi]|uniref:sodium- and chloride-dependent glycine transporter 1 isoform X2 n=1 Tax=Drosophila grimshawi TaxID=7222 RepID=UPI000C870626|nr:sodium- and chloride-dependent glycine transporter 1 isoform X2 [Drosophila grimshawi]
MKGICGDAKQQVNNCMLLDDSEASTEYGHGIGNGNVHQGSRSLRARQVCSLAIRNTSSYDTMERPFRPDNLRGGWSKTADFYFASCTYAFSTMVFSDAPVWAVIQIGWRNYLIAYLLSVFIFSLPIFLIQTFLGQFSTSGAISAFRVSPIFKGIGYSIFLLNLGTLTYYSVNAAVPLIYAVNSMYDIMPWKSCNNTWNTPECSTHDSYDEESDYQKPHTTVEFFHSMISSIKEDAGAWTLSWSMVLAIMVIWPIVLALLLRKVSLIGKWMRCACVLMFGLFVATFVYMVMHEPEEYQRLIEYQHPSIFKLDVFRSAVGVAILQASLVLGPSWGSIITLGSYNSFRSDAERLSVWVCVTHVLVSVVGLVCSLVANDYFELHVVMFHADKLHPLQFVYLVYSYLFGSFATLPRLWSFLFFAVIFLAEMCALIIQMMSVLTAIFDEFEQLRPKKKPITILLVLCLMATSVYFCTQMGFRQAGAFSYMTVFTQMIISGVLILMATWIYGRKRFQCDLQFMLGKTISNLKIFCIRCVVPFFVALGLWETFYMLTQNGGEEYQMWISQTVIYLIALGYMFFKLSQTNGTWRQRMKQCFAPHDWHPVSADNRHFYEEIMGNSEMLVIDNGNAA